MIHALLAVATVATTVQLEATAVDNRIEVRGPRAVWKTREIHRLAERTVVFVPGATVNAVEAKNSKAYPAKRGAVFVVTPANAKLANHLRFSSRSAAPVDSTPVAPTPRRTKTKRAVRSALPGPVLADIEKAQRPAEPTKKAPVEAKPEPVVERLRGDSNAGMIRLLGALAVIALLAVGAWWFRRRRPGFELDENSIEIISVKTLGPKHRLAIIEAGGERLLIAASDSEVRLLSTLGFAAGTQSTTEPVDEPQPETTEDVAGLLRLRDESGAARDFDAVLKSVNPTQYVA